MDLKVFEKQKNIKALGYTAMVCSAIACIFLLVSWMPSSIVAPQDDQGIEVNLGNGDDGMGNEIIDMAGAPSNTQIIDPVTAPPETMPAAAEEVISKPVAENNEPDAPPIHTPVKKPVTKPKPKHTETALAKKKPHAKVVAQQPVQKPAPKAKALFKGATAGTGGNNADSYNKGVMSQGNTGKPGIQGRENGTANLGRYDGNGGTGTSGTGTGMGRNGGAVKIRSGLKNRSIVKLPAFEDDFNEPAKVAVDVEVDKQGIVLSASINPRGTTTINTNIRGIALNRAKQLKFSQGESNSSGTIILDFKLRE